MNKVEKFIKNLMDRPCIKKIKEIRKQEGKECSLREQFYIAKTNEFRFKILVGITTLLHTMSCVGLVVSGVTGFLFLTISGDSLIVPVIMFLGILLVFLTALMNHFVQIPLAEELEGFKMEYERFKYESAILWHELQIQNIEWRREV